MHARHFAAHLDYLDDLDALSNEEPLSDAPADADFGADDMTHISSQQDAATDGFDDDAARFDSYEALRAFSEPDDLDAE